MAETDPRVNPKQESDLETLLVVSKQLFQHEGKNLERLVGIYETILSTTDDFAYIFDSGGRFLYANARLLAVWAKTHGEIVGKTGQEIRFPGWPFVTHVLDIEKILRDKLPIRGEAPFKGESGLEGVYNYNLKPVLNAEGEVELIVGTMRDVSEQRRYEEKLKRAEVDLRDRAKQLEAALAAKSRDEQRYRFLADTVPQIVWTAKPDGSLDYYNQRWFDYAGTTLAEMENKPWTWYVHSDDLPNAGRVWQHALETGENYEVEFRIIRASDQTYRWHLVRAFPMRDGDEKIVLWVGTCTDIDDQRKLTGSLEEALKKLRLYFDSDIIGNIIADLDGRVYEANDEYLRIIGYTREDLLSEKVRWDAITPPEFLDIDVKAIQQARQNGFSEPYEKQYNRKDGTRIWVLIGFLIFDETKTIAFVLDISDKKATEFSLIEAQSRLKAHSEELESIVETRTATLHQTIEEIEHFSYAIVHDLRAPLRAMEGYVDIIQEELDSADKAMLKEYIGRVKIASRRMDNLITDSLDYSKAAREELKLEKVNLYELLIGLVQTYPNLRAELLDLKVDPNLPLVLGNQAALTQCFSNLLGNAVKFKRPGTKCEVVIRTEKAPNSSTSTGRVSLKSAKYVRIWVEDNGPGIPKRFHERVFGLFQRATKDHEGTGLGLAIVRKVVERISGRVGLESEEGQGSRFWVDLLLPEDDEAV